MKILFKFVLMLNLSLVMISCSNTVVINGEKKINLDSLLDEMISFDEAAKYPSPYYSCRQVSSYDRHTTSKDNNLWFANDDGSGYEYLDTIGSRIEKVMFDEKGPGVITRIWMTTSSRKGTIRMYLDGEKEASIVIPAYDMQKFPIKIGTGLSFIHTHYGKEVFGFTDVGGNTFFLPVPYRKECRITFEEPDYSVKIPRYYHINYRTYSSNIDVETFSLEQVSKLTKKIENICQTLLNPPTFREGVISKASNIVSKGKSLKMTLPTGSNALRTLLIHIDELGSNYSEVMGKVNISIFFDGIKCVDVPLSDFAGAGIGAPEVHSWYIDCDAKGSILSRWVMPYKESASVVITNNTNFSLNISTECNTDIWKWDDNSLYFHTSHKYQMGIPLNNDYNSDDNLDWNFTTISGRGIYRGDVLSLYNHAPSWYGEGDEKIWIDNEFFPSHFGTGTEDYYNCSWAPVIVFHTPFGGAIRSDENSSHGYNTFMRTRNLDAIPFKTSFVFDIEMLSWEKGTVDYYTTSFWYGDLMSK